MRWLANILGSKRQLKKVRLEASVPHWQIQPPIAFSALLGGLNKWLPDEAILYFEGAFTTPDIQRTLVSVAVPEQARIARGTLLPTPVRFHVPAKGNLELLAALMKTRENLELAEHFHVYSDGEMILEWFDVIDQPVRVSGNVSEDRVRTLAELLGARYTRESN